MIDLQRLAEELEQDFTEQYAEFEGTTVLAPPVPLDLEVLCEELYPDDVTDNAYELVGESAGLLPMVEFEWKEDGAKPFHMRLDLMALGELVYLTISPDEAISQAWEVIAAFESYTPAVLTPLFRDMLTDNGTRLGVDLLSSLPTRIESKFIKPITFVVGFRDYLNWDEERSPGAWATAAGYLPEELRHHERLRKSAEAIKGGGNLDDKDEFVAAYVVATFAGDVLQ